MKITRTKILITVGPATLKSGVLDRILEYGVRLFRFNFKHNTVDWHKQAIQKVRQAAGKYGVEPVIILDLQGPSVRVVLNQETLEIHEGKTYDLVAGNPKSGQISITYPEQIEKIPTDKLVYMDNGRLKFKLVRKGEKTYLYALNSGELKPNVSFNVQNFTFEDLPLLTKRDKIGVKLAPKWGVDYLAISFVRNAQDIRNVRELLKEHSAKVGIVSKLETLSAIHNIYEILKESDVSMLGRGDLALEIPYYKVPVLQKEIIATSRQIGKPIIVATQMLESLTHQPFPTRAEISDVANAAFDKADSLMLSEETAIGVDPANAVEVMYNIIREVEASFIDVEYTSLVYEVSADFAHIFAQVQRTIQNVCAAVLFLTDLYLLEQVSRLRPKAPIFVVTKPNSTIARKAWLFYGVKGVHNAPLVTGESKTPYVEFILEQLARLKVCKPQSSVLVLFDTEFPHKKAAYDLQLISV